jgi:hypothetical protein
MKRPVVRSQLSVIRYPLSVVREEGTGNREHEESSCQESGVSCPLSVVRCPLSGKREQGTGNMKSPVVRSPLSVSVVSYQLSVVRCPLSVVKEIDARKIGDRTQENPSIWRKIADVRVIGTSELVK